MAHPAVCPCPNCRSGAGGALAAVIAVVVAIFAVVVFVVTHLWLVLGGLAFVAAGAVAFQWVLLRRTVLVRVTARAPRARAALPAPRPAVTSTAPRAIGPRRALPGVVVRTETGEEVRLLRD